jgi:endonuclease-8
VPEGDTIHRAAAALRTALVGRPTESFTAPRLVGIRPAEGRVVERVDAHGKHLHIGWDDGIVLHTHMRMSGAWHLYRSGERWRKPQSHMVVSIQVPDWQAICFDAPIVETYREFDKRRHPGFGHLGPDLCRADADLDECVRRMATYDHPDETIVDVLLDQRVACGVGNVYKSEVLYACRVSPFAVAAELSDGERLELIETAARLLQANVNRTSRSTVDDPRGGLAVYGRNGKPCRRCGDTILVRKTGRHQRATYWCPTCQYRHDPQPQVEVTPTGLVRPLVADPHPAATQFLSQLPTRKVDLYDHAEDGDHAEPS